LSKDGICKFEGPFPQAPLAFEEKRKIAPKNGRRAAATLWYYSK